MRVDDDTLAGSEDIRKRNLVDALYRKYGQALLNFLMRRHITGDDAGDIVHETYCRVIRSGDVERIRHPKAFLFRVANNVLRNATKRRGIGVEGDALDIESVQVKDESPGPYRRVQSEQELAIVRAALEELTPRCREVFVMNRFGDMSYTEIAAELGLSLSMIEKYISQALSHLRKRVVDADSARRGPIYSDSSP